MTRISIKVPVVSGDAYISTEDKEIKCVTIRSGDVFIELKNEHLKPFFEALNLAWKMLNS